MNRRLLREHLEGHKTDGTDVIGIYPMLPAQDKMPAGGLGNLIANPWKLMEVVKKKTKDWTAEGVLGILAADMSGKGAEEAEASAKPWEKKAGIKIFEEDITGM